MAKENETIIRLHQGIVSVEQMPGDHSVVLLDYDVENMEPEDLHVDSEGGWYLKKRLYADGSEWDIKTAKEKSAQAELDSQLDDETKTDEQE